MKKGRRTDLRLLRDKRMVEKFHELYDIKRMRIEDVLSDLEQKYFFIDKTHIYNLIFRNNINNLYYDSLLKKQANKNQLKLFPNEQV